MDKVLPSQTNWPHPAPHAQSRQQEDFAKKLPAKSQKESGRPIVDRFTTTGDSAAPAPRGKGIALLPGAESGAGEGDRPGVLGDIAPSILESDNPDACGNFGPAAEAGVILESASAPSIGLLSGTLTWSRVYPEHLIASGYLSMVDTAANGGGVLPERLVCVGPDADIRGSDKSATPTADLNPDAGSAATSLFGGLHQSIADGMAAEGLGTDSEVASSTRKLDAAMFADRFWAERLVRLTHDGDGQSTIWLRDYRLKANDFESVAAKLRWHGRQEGAPISRVVINGREVWRAAAWKEES